MMQVLLGVSLETGTAHDLLGGNVETNASYHPVSVPEFRFSKVESEFKRFSLAFFADGLS